MTTEPRPTIADMVKANGDGFNLRPQLRGGTYVLERQDGYVVASRLSKRAARGYALSLDKLRVHEVAAKCLLGPGRALRSCRGAMRRVDGVKFARLHASNGTWWGASCPGDENVYGGRSKRTALRNLRAAQGTFLGTPGVADLDGTIGTEP